MSILVCYEAGADILWIVVFKKMSARYCTCLHLHRDKESFFWNVQIQLSQTPL